SSGKSSSACEHHLRIIDMSSIEVKKDLDPMERFLAEGPTEQSTLFIRWDTGELSTSKGCTCEANS
ncbi:hypothetical protein EK21DRAFT_39469, partial [Setomelanomma holmii]